jgi:hypothetical protein
MIVDERLKEELKNIATRIATIRGYLKSWSRRRSGKTLPNPRNF